MSSEKQILANQSNSLKSTGPRSQAGKAIVRFNAKTHGLTALQPILPDENASQFALLQESLHEELKPEGALEEMLVERIILLSARLQRLSRIEMGLFIQVFCEQVLDHEYDNELRRDPSILNGSSNPKRLEQRRRFNTLKHVEDPQAKARITKAREQMNDDTSLMGAAYRRDAQNADAFSKLLRYETTLEKSLFRALHELQRLQGARFGKQVLPPMVVDVNLSSG
jgi:hypothetical protein